MQWRPISSSRARTSAFVFLHTPALPPPLLRPLQLHSFFALLSHRFDKVISAAQKEFDTARELELLSNATRATSSSALDAQPDGTTNASASGDATTAPSLTQKGADGSPLIGETTTTAHAGVASLRTDARALQPPSTDAPHGVPGGVDGRDSRTGTTPIDNAAAAIAGLDARLAAASGHLAVAGEAALRASELMSSVASKSAGAVPVGGRAADVLASAEAEAARAALAQAVDSWLSWLAIAAPDPGERAEVPLLRQRVGHM